MEMNKLIELLEENGIPFETELDIFGGIQVFYPNEENAICDVICHEFSFGGNKGLLEMMGLVECDDDAVEGYLKAKEVFKRIQKHYNILLKNNQ